VDEVCKTVACVGGIRNLRRIQVRKSEWNRLLASPRHVGGDNIKMDV